MRFRLGSPYPTFIRSFALAIVLCTLFSVGAVLAAVALTTEDLTGPLDPADLATLLVGEGLAVTNVTYTGDEQAAGRFSGGGGIIGFEQGIVLSTGAIADVIGPNTDDATTTEFNTPGDADLSVLADGETFDAAVLEFDLVPTGENIFFQFVFSSEEYNEFVGSQFNDVFAFYVNGNNCALVEGDPISINTINNGDLFGDFSPSHPEFYIDNTLEGEGGSSINTEMDGLTTVLTCTAPVTPNTTNHLKLAVADVSDAIYDTAVFIEAGSLSTVAPTISLGPPSASLCIPDEHTVVATVTDNQGNPLEGTAVTFEVQSGPNAGQNGVVPTNASGQASFTYSSTATGTDTIRATFQDPQGNTIVASPVTIEWRPEGECTTAISLATFGATPARNPLPFAALVLGATLLAGLVAYWRSPDAKP